MTAPQTAIPDLEEIRALAMHFAASPWQDLHVRTAKWTVFMAKPGGSENPMLAVPGHSENMSTVDAPHLGLFTAAVAAGSVLTAGMPIGRLEVLGKNENVASEKAGRIIAILADGGELVEYGTPLVRIAA
jgi:acetyl-CoA carboxylase biotin carboxyl carrier protein